MLGKIVTTCPSFLVPDADVTEWCESSDVWSCSAPTSADASSNYEESGRGSMNTAPIAFHCQAERQDTLLSIRAKYLIVTLAIMLADGLQGTHLYVLYESYGFSVASLFSLGFIAGAVATPITGPLIDKFGRRRSALLYCALEIWINQLEQYPCYAGLVVSRVVGGITTNLLNSVFEAWLDTECRLQGLEKDKYEVILRDAVVVSNLAAIASGCLAHLLAEKLGPVGPFRGAVSCTGVALLVILVLWSENFGSLATTMNGHASADDVSQTSISTNSGREIGGATCDEDDERKKRSLLSYLADASNAFLADSRMLRVGILQGLTGGSLQIFIFLWSPTLQTFSGAVLPQSASSYWLDSANEPAYGLIFGAYMTCGVLGGLCSPILRRAAAYLVAPVSGRSTNRSSTKAAPDLLDVTIDEEQPLAEEFLATVNYMTSALLLTIPCFMDPSNPKSFGTSLTAFLLHEFLIGVVLPCEGVIRSLYMPADDRATMMTLPRMMVNLAVSLGVLLTHVLPPQTCFAGLALLMTIAGTLQLSLISSNEWKSLWYRIDNGIEPVFNGLKTSLDSFLYLLPSSQHKARRLKHD